MAPVSLTSSLIARKGNAKPSVPSSGFGKSLLPHDSSTSPSTSPSTSIEIHNAALAADNVSILPVKKPTRQSLKAIWSKARPAQKRVKKTLRLEMETHLALLDLGRVRGKSQQYLMLEAVKALLARSNC